MKIILKRLLRNILYAVCLFVPFTIMTEGFKIDPNNTGYVFLGLFAVAIIIEYIKSEKKISKYICDFLEYGVSSFVIAEICSSFDHAFMFAGMPYAIMFAYSLIIVFVINLIFIVISLFNKGTKKKKTK